MLAAMACRFVLTDGTHDYQGLVLIAVFVTVLSAAGSISVTFGFLLLVEFLLATLLLIMAQFEGPSPDREGLLRRSRGFALISFVFAFGVFVALPGGRWIHQGQPGTGGTDDRVLQGRDHRAGASPARQHGRHAY